MRQGEFFEDEARAEEDYASHTREQYKEALLVTALADVERGADPGWTTKALGAVKATCVAMDSFISDDVWRVGKLAPTRENRAMGAILVRAAKKGWCKKTDQCRKAYGVSKTTHPYIRQVWQSLIYAGYPSRNGAKDTR